MTGTKADSHVSEDAETQRAVDRLFEASVTKPPKPQIHFDHLDLSEPSEMNGILNPKPGEELKSNNKSTNHPDYKTEAVSMT